MKALQTVNINPKNAILIIVDMQREFCQPGGKLYTKTSAGIMPAITSSIQKIGELARNTGIPVIYIQGLRTLKEPEFTVFHNFPHIEIGTPAAEIIEELKPDKEDILIQKYCHDPFYKTELDKVLKKLVPEPSNCCALITGGTIDVCAYHTVMGFHIRDYWTVVLTDSVYYLTDADYNRALEQFSGPAYPNVFLSRADMVNISPVPKTGYPELKPL